MKYKLTESQYKRIKAAIKEQNDDEIENIPEKEEELEYDVDDPFGNTYDAKDKKRYAITIDFYFFGKNDEDILKRADSIINFLDKKYDNRPKLISVDETPFASFHSRKVK